MNAYSLLWMLLAVRAVFAVFVRVCIAYSLRALYRSTHGLSAHEVFTGGARQLRRDRAIARSPRTPRAM